MSAQQIVTDNLDLWTSAVTQKSSAGRGSNGKLELTGIKKLRELILELAVRGKLVPQDPNDEPASELLKRIEAEKARLVKEGTIKKPKKLPEISEDEKPFGLPEGWGWSKLGHVSADIHYGYTASADNNKAGVRLLRITDIQNDSVDWDFVPGCQISEQQAASYLLKDGDILIARTGGTIGKSYLVKDLSVDSVFASYLIRVKKLDEFSSAYTKRYLGSNLYWKQLYKFSMGTGQPNVNGNSLKNLLIPVPPIAEQARIVEKVDELMALCDHLEQQTSNQISAHETLVDALLGSLLKPAEGSLDQAKDAAELADNWARLATHFDTLFTTEHSIERLKQTILQLAVMGRLVPQDPNDEPASELLRRIKSEKAQLVKESKIKKPKNLPAISRNEEPYMLPSTWAWCRLEELSLHSEAGWSPKCEDQPRENNDWGVLKVSAVTWGVYNPNENKKLPSHLAPRPEYEVEENDFLISRANTSDLVARSVIVPTSTPKKLMMSDKIIRFKFSSLVYANFVNLVNNSSFARRYYAANAGGTSSSMKNVSRLQIQSLLVPLPPEPEQHRIIAKVDALMTLCDQLKARVQVANDTRLVLASAVVEEALKA